MSTIKAIGQNNEMVILEAELCYQNIFYNTDGTVNYTTIVAPQGLFQQIYSYLDGKLSTISPYFWFGMS